MKKKLIVILKGGLGNQLFTYAVAYRLAKANNAELVLDDYSGFHNDKLYNRKFELDIFSIPERRATYVERLPLVNGLVRRVLIKLNSYLPFHKRIFLTQEIIHFDQRLLSVRFKTLLYLDGLWQSESYFSDVVDDIRARFRFKDLERLSSLEHLKLIQGTNSVAIHFRFFEDSINEEEVTYNLKNSYYIRAIEYFTSMFTDLHFFVFTDNLSLFQKKMDTSKLNVTVVSSSNSSFLEDFFLMSNCRHFILANSTFSWWAAWLGKYPGKKVVVSSFYSDIGISGWGFDGLIPEDWTKL